MSEMITDEKRRKVVHTLRQLDNVVDDDEDLDRTIAHEASILSMIRDATFGLDGSIFQRLADLIDRPTCRNNGDRDDRGFVCSACGYEAWTSYDSNCDPSDFSFCPDCGAEVVEDD